MFGVFVADGSEASFADDERDGAMQRQGGELANGGEVKRVGREGGDFFPEQGGAEEKSAGFEIGRIVAQAGDFGFYLSDAGAL